MIIRYRKAIEEKFNLKGAEAEEDVIVSDTSTDDVVSDFARIAPEKRKRRKSEEWSITLLGITNLE